MQSSASSSLDSLMARWQLKKNAATTNTDTNTKKHEEEKEQPQQIVLAQKQPNTITLVAPAASASSAPSASSTTPPLPSLTDYLPLLNRQLNLLLDSTSTTSQRIECYDSLSTNLLRSGLPKEYASVAYPTALKPLLKRFGEERERCRLSAIDLVRRIISDSTQIERLICYIIPVIAYRMGTIDLSDAPITLGANTTMHERAAANPNAAAGAEADVSGASPSIHKQAKPVLPATSEQSSTVRLALLNTLYTLLLRCTQQELTIFLPDIIQIVYTSLMLDSDPDVKAKLCELVMVLCEDYKMYMRGFSKILMIPIMKNVLLHKSSAVRILGVRVVGCLIPLGAAELIRDLAAFRESNIIDIHGFYHGEARTNYFARLVSDDNKRVREAFMEVLCEWCLNLQERADYETLLMPYLFSGLCDPDISISSSTHTVLQAIGKVYETEEKERLASGVGGSSMDEGAFRLKLMAEEESREYLTSVPILLYPPFASTSSTSPQRPGWGERQLGRKFFDRLLHAILSEHTDWKSDVRQRSWTLLRLLLMYAEEHVTQYTAQILTSVQKTLCEAAAQNVSSADTKVIYDCVSLLARYADPTILLSILTHDLHSKAIHDTTRLRTNLQVQRTCLQYIPPSHVNYEQAMEEWMENVLEKSEIYFTHDVDVFTEYLTLVHTILTINNSNNSGSSSKMNHLIMKYNSQLFKTILECAMWKRSGGVRLSNALPTSSSSSSTCSILNACYTELVRHTLLNFDEPSEDLDSPSSSQYTNGLLLVFQSHLLPLLRDEERFDLASIQAWSENSLQVAMLVEVLERVGPGGVMTRKCNEHNAVDKPVAEQIATRMEELLLSLLKNSDLGVNAIVLKALAKIASAPATPPLSNSFLAALRELISSHRTEFEVRFSDESLAPKSLSINQRTTREEEKKYEGDERRKGVLREKKAAFLAAATALSAN